MKVAAGAGRSSQVRPCSKGGSSIDESEGSAGVGSLARARRNAGALSALKEEKAVRELSCGFMDLRRGGDHRTPNRDSIETLTQNWI